MIARAVLIRGARQLLTLRGPAGPRRGDALQDLGVIDDGSLLIRNGVIANVGPTRRIENLAEARSATEIDATGRVVMPGFNDPHARLIGPPARILDYPMGAKAVKMTSAEIARAAQQYLRSTPPGRLKFQARRVIERSVRHGTTGIEAKCGYGLDNTAELKTLRVMSAADSACCSVIATFIAAAFSEQFNASIDKQLDWICRELLPKIRISRLAVFAEALCAPAGFTIEQARTFLSAARRLGFALKVQIDQTPAMGAVRLAVEMEARAVAGLDFCDQFDADMLSRSRTVALLMATPGCRDSRSGLLPARLLIDSGVAVALASGYSPSLPAMFGVQPVLSLACVDMGMTAEEAISATTINAAHAMNRAAKTGSLEFGKQADLIILDVPGYREIPYHLGVNQVELTMRKGEVVYREGAITCPAQ